MRAVAFVVLALIAPSGCGEGKPQTAPVSGVVKYLGSPLTRAAG